MTEDEWIQVRDGVRRKPLARYEEKKMQLDIIEIAPNLSDKPHYHDDIEWVYVLEGELEDEKGKHKKGDFFINNTTDVHAPVSKTGAKLLCFWCGSTSPVKD